MQHSDYMTRAAIADAEANAAATAELAKGWHQVAEVYRALAAQERRMHARRADCASPERDDRIRTSL